MAKNKKKETTFGKPGAFAVARYHVGGDLAAAALFYRLAWRWKSDKKLERLGKEWIAMSRSEWAKEAGLSDAEMKNRALPKLKKCSFVKIRAMKLKANKKALWMSLDLEALYQSTLAVSEETAQALLNGAKFPGYEKAANNYHYKCDELEKAKYG
ncbi:MAG: hypothetical protein V4691_00430 [Pseudomonadota bacterium]